MWLTSQRLSSSSKYFISFNYYLKLTCQLLPYLLSEPVILNLVLTPWATQTPGWMNRHRPALLGWKWVHAHEQNYFEKMHFHNIIFIKQAVINTILEMLNTSTDIQVPSRKQEKNPNVLPNSFITWMTELDSDWVTSILASPKWDKHFFLTRNYSEVPVIVVLKLPPWPIKKIKHAKH